MLPYVQGRINATLFPPGASSCGDWKVPASWKSGKVIAISSIVNVEELRILDEKAKPRDSVKIAIRDVIK